MKENEIIDKLIKLSKKAYKKDEIPVACIIIKNNKIISYAYNKKNKTKNVVHHAELLAISKACRKIKDWRLNDCILYTTLFPCPMCASAIVQSRISTVRYIFDSGKLDDKSISNTILSGILVEKLDYSYNIISDFFKKIRK